MSDIQDLLSENTKLRTKVAQMESEIEFLKTHPSIAQGIKGETLACDIIGGEITPYSASHDLVIGTSAKIEVKFIKINTPVEKWPASHRWNWSKVLGWQDYKTGKDYDFLLLIGDKDPYFLSQYPDDGSPYVFFLIPQDKISETLSKGGRIGSQIQINTNLKTARSRRSRAIKKYMVSLTQISDIVRLQTGGGDNENPGVSWRDVGSNQLFFHGLGVGATP